MGVMSLSDDACLFDLTRSTKCASKQRRDQINSEIGVLRDLLPLPESARVRLSQLQIMSLSCVYVRKCALLQRVFGDVPFNISTPFDFFQVLSGFLLVTTQEGKLVYISENVTEYLGHSMVDMKTQGDSIYDIIDKRDHATVHNQLSKAESSMASNRDLSFFCRMNMSRCLKRQTSPADIKIMHVKGHFKRVPCSDPSDTTGQKSLFMAICSPLLTPEVKETIIHNNTMTFKSTHSLDMKYTQISQNGEVHLGLNNKMLTGQSWYGMIHPDDIYEAREKHMNLLSSQSEQGCLMTVRMISALCETKWVNIAMSLKSAPGHNMQGESVIECINQVISEEEANQFRMHSQMYSLYQSRGIDMLCNGTFSTIASTSANILDSFMDRVSEQSSPAPQNAPCTPPAATTETHITKPNQKQDVATMRKLEHEQTMLALKRKLGENSSAISSYSKPRKMSRYESSSSSSSHSSSPPAYIYTPSAMMSPVSPIFSYDTNNPQVMRAITSPIHRSGSVYTNMKGNIRLSSPPHTQPIIIDIAKATLNQEQVVPDWYLTPEASPTCSPQSFSEADVRALAQSLDAKLKEVKTEVKKEITSCSFGRKPAARPLPVIDASVIDEFFDQVASPQKSSTPPPSMRERSTSGSYNQVAPDLTHEAMLDMIDYSSFNLMSSIKAECMSPEYTTCMLGSPESMDGDVITEEEAQATLSLLNLPAPLLAPHRHMMTYSHVWPPHGLNSNIHGLVGTS